jgi:hypothetical protein
VELLTGSVDWRFSESLITRDGDKTLKESPDFYFQNSCVVIMKTQTFIYEFMHREVMIVKL